ncbi:unnamed protein product [Miscanthus lutarioriparius]|uniref:Uncharacterized protein n=1 Tax=Miscanthus lutarioriparius TaxID=422564 RepID=A0A811R9M6_9POAL|nr:unnamed protein product [Miscanthus lutarioriparius]
MTAAAAAAAARCVPHRASPPETAKAPASIPTSSAATASALLPRRRRRGTRPPAPGAAAPVLLLVSGEHCPAGSWLASGGGRTNVESGWNWVCSEIIGADKCHSQAIVLADVYRFGNRQAFNVAFRSLGLDCANWTEPIYADLVRKARGDEERMLALFFDRIGWPTSLPTSEKGSFIKSVLREKLWKSSQLLIAYHSRPGVETFIDDALSEGVPLAILAAYGRNGEKISRSIAMKLGPERISKIKIVGKVEVEESFYGQLVLGKGVTSGVDEQLVREAQKAASAEKQRIAEEVASILKLSVDITASESSEKVIAALRTGSEYVGCDVQNCVLVAGSQSGVLAAERIGMPCIVVRSSFTARAEFHSAKAVMDGFREHRLNRFKTTEQKVWSALTWLTNSCDATRCSTAPDLNGTLAPAPVEVVGATTGRSGSQWPTSDPTQPQLELNVEWTRVGNLELSGEVTRVGDLGSNAEGAKISLSIALSGRACSVHSKYGKHLEIGTCWQPLCFLNSIIHSVGAIYGQGKVRDMLAATQVDMMAEACAVDGVLLLNHFCQSCQCCSTPHGIPEAARILEQADFVEHEY